jgi:hypothetical protein
MPRPFSTARLLRGWPAGDARNVLHQLVRGWTDEDIAGRAIASLA